MNEVQAKAPMSLEKIVADLNPVQKEAVLHDRGPLLILAGAGSGKTRVITRRMAYLLASGKALPEEILAITFTNKAAKEMKERLGELIAYQGYGMWVGTFHSMMLRILRRHAERLDFTPQFSILDVDEQLALIRSLMKQLGLSDKQLTPRRIQQQISSAKNRMDSPEAVAQKAYGHPDRLTVAQVYRAYQAALKASNAMDFDDILWHCVRLLEEDAEVLAAYQARFRYILVDEYQDTNRCQYLLIKYLSAKHRNLCVVGDDDQSIYRFRGANLQNILDFEKDFAPCKTVKLEQNYRSTASILGAANAVIASNEARKEKRLWTEQGAGQKLRFYRAQDHYAEARYIAREIRHMMHRSSQPVPGEEIAILYRVNALSRNLESAFRDAGISYQIYGGLRFYDRKEIKDLLAYLRLLDNPHDESALQRIINVPRRGIGSVTMERLAERAAEQGCSRFRIMEEAQRYPELGRVASRLLDFVFLLHSLRERLASDQGPYAEFVDFVMEKTGMQLQLKAEAKQGSDEAAQRLENLRELRSDAMEFEAQTLQDLEQFQAMEEERGEASPYRSGLASDSHLLMDPEHLDLQHCNRLFLERASLYTQEDEGEEQAVSLMSIHAAKGLEFDVVFLAGADEGIFPSYRAMDAQEDMEEERRLAYVALTRARKLLVSSSVRSRLLYGQTRAYGVSRFIQDIPADLVEEIGGHRHPPAESQAPSHFGEGRSSAYFAGFATRDSRVAPAPPKKAQASARGLRIQDLSLQMTLYHRRYGKGILTRMDRVSGDAILCIDFDGISRRMMASMAPLSLEEDEG